VLGVYQEEKHKRHYFPSRGI